MSILQALQDFLEGYEGMELRPLGEILTDQGGTALLLPGPCGRWNGHPGCGW